MNWRFAKLLNNNFKKNSQISACIISDKQKRGATVDEEKNDILTTFEYFFFANFANVTNVITDKLHSGKHKQDTPC